MKNAPSAPRRGPVAVFLEMMTFPLRGPLATFSAFIILLVFFAGGFAYAWQRWGGLVRNHPRYAVVAEQLEVTPQPEWIKSDVKAEVLRDNGLTSLTLLDPQVTVKVARAFGLHSWVSDVRRVRKEYPSRLVVEIDYRRPVAMVEVTTNGQRGLLPVDAKGVLLPPNDFTTEQTADYVRIGVGETLPAGSPGTSWGDPHVAGAAAIASALGNAWRTARIYRVALMTTAEPTRGKVLEPEYLLVTRDGAQVIWGRAPGKEAAAETPAAEKVARLTRFLEQLGGKVPAAGTRSLDLRDPGGISTTSGVAEPVSTPGSSSPPADALDQSFDP